MGVLVKNFEEVRRVFRSISRTGRLCCFFAIDDRPSLAGALQALYDCRQWIDTMAAATDIFAFVPIQAETEPTEYLMIGERMMTSEESEYESSLPTIDYVLNPSIQLAAHFGIAPRELPGLVFFEALADGMAGKACFVSIPERHLAKGEKGTEKFLAILFSEMITSFQHGDRTDLTAVLRQLKRFLTQGCKARLATATIEEPVVAAIEKDFDDARSKAFEPEDLRKIYAQLPAKSRRETKIFLSYAREDYKTVKQFYERLRRAGFSPWMDKEDLLPGEQWENQIDSQMKSADFIMIFLSQRSVRKRGYLQVELKRALKFWEQQLQDDIYLIPVKIDNCTVPEPLSAFQWLSFGQYYDGWRRMFQALVEGYRRREKVDNPKESSL